MLLVVSGDMQDRLTAVGPFGCGMECHICQAEVIEGGRFCTACGAPVSCFCPSCLSLNPPSARFCGTCGISLKEPPAKPISGAPQFGAERRQLTIAFFDLVGSTQLAASLDPEDYQSLLGAYHRA